MNPPDEIREKVISLLQDIGAADNLEFKRELSAIPEADSVIGHLPGHLKSREVILNADQLESAIRGICRIEGWTGNHFSAVPERLIFGSTSVIPHLLKMLDQDKIEQEGALIDWLFSHRTNPYIPFGYQIPLGINSREEYGNYEERRAKHREERNAIDQEAHRAAVARKEENTRLHAERSAANRNLREPEDRPSVS